ncbi:MULTISPECIES: hypothetical protein [Polaribacter]|uniref:Uncharacterized protein n=1 Tax=Polaribacter sejongensis TaxID=985043 RepID=A0AAJ1QV45_9FLAO|nr:MULTISPECIES: hypothetical protein [Polaribacter]AUC21965.1 hypothetical protein BTO15_07560 [Polaribacter sejongensis]MDN3618615.1 hypothetical protein [Polaribacter undariae]UWD30404.1 hypothetical protein NQP51_09650 [Polaribacter undariae]
MEENKKVLYLMQNVCDKLDALSGNVNIISDSQVECETFAEFIELEERIVSNQNMLIKSQTTMNSHIIDLEKKIELLGNKPKVIHQKKEYYLFGKDTPFSSKLLLITIAFIFIASSGFKYIPIYLTENSAIKTERDEYELFYQYVFLDAYSKNNKISKNIVSTLNDIQQKDTVLLQYVHKLSKQYNTQLQKEALEKQLENLDKER